MKKRLEIRIREFQDLHGPQQAYINSSHCKKGVDLKAVLSVDPQPVRFLWNFLFSSKTCFWYCFIFQFS